LENNDQHILDESMNRLVPTSWMKRLLNYFIDIIVFSILLTILLAAIAPVFPMAARWLQHKPGTDGLLANQFTFSDQLLISFTYGLYMSLLEAILKGKSIGKLITRTRAVDMHGQAIGSQAAFVRGLIRIIPFEQLSAISNPCRLWHDRWSGTVVVDDK
jgi:uncharacterized RDD family membrane protein YckC